MCKQHYPLNRKCLEDNVLSTITWHRDTISKITGQRTRRRKRNTHQRRKGRTAVKAESSIVELHHAHRVVLRQRLGHSVVRLYAK